MRSVLVPLPLLVLPLSSSFALHAQEYGILGQQAPELRIDTWYNLPKENAKVRLADLRGKVVYLYCFQRGCPACLKHGFPLLKRLVSTYRDKSDIVFLAAQTVFERHGHNTAKEGAKLMKRFGLKIPWAHDVGPKGKRSSTLDDFNTGGTPWVIVLDRDGVVRYNGYAMNIPFPAVVRAIDRVRNRKPLLGSPFGRLEHVEFVGKPWKFAAHEFTLLRWWTSGCPFCADSLPALEALRKRHRNLDVLAIHHPKPLGGVVSRTVVAEARRLGFEGSIALDQKWQLLRALQKRGLPTRSTSVSVLVDKKGIIRWIHQGPRLHDDKGGRYPRAVHSLRELENLLAPAKRRVERREKKREKKRDKNRQ